MAGALLIHTVGLNSEKLLKQTLRLFGWSGWLAGAGQPSHMRTVYINQPAVFFHKPVTNKPTVPNRPRDVYVSSGPPIIYSVRCLLILVVFKTLFNSMV